MSEFQEITTAYERWRGERMPVVANDVTTKHAKLATSPFALLRGTYYRFLQQFERRCPELASAPRAVAVGDLHVENFGTWRDFDARIAWGVNDFDEIDLLPYTLDLVRLATSASLAISAGHLVLPPAEACDAIAAGWRAGIGQGRPAPFVLGERHEHLYKLASEAFVDPIKFERGIRRLPAWEGKLPKAAARVLADAAPWPEFEPELRRRVAGVGSLGSRRIVAFAEVCGGLVVREAKQIPGPASGWLWPGRRPAKGLADLVARSRGVAGDPWRRQTRRWVMRPLAPDAARLELATLKRKHSEGALLQSMGEEAANVHLVNHRDAAKPKQLLRHEAGLPTAWLRRSAATMVKLTEKDYSDWTSKR